ncbi:MAG: 3'-5' exoribonuclease YhaM family protein [Terriglobia bacterium]
MKKAVFIRDLRPRQAVQDTFLVRHQARRSGRNGSAYLDLELQDSTGVVPAKLWDCGEAPLDFDADDLVFVSATVEDYQGRLQLRLEKVHRSLGADADLRDYLPTSTRDAEEMYAALLARAGRMNPGLLRQLVEAVLGDPTIASAYKLAPAATTYHHAYLGGLLEHVLSVSGLADRVADHYPSLDRDLVLAGIVLHDLGKIQELSYARGFRYSTRGQLLGHIAIGLEMVWEKMRAIPGFPSGLKDRVTHIILSHHGKLEFGSPKEPMFPEALVVHYVDDLDSKLEAMRAQYAADQEREGDWTTRNRALGRELLKKGVGSRE